MSDIERVIEILDKVKSKTYTEELLNELYSLHNDITGYSETNIKCGGCRRRVIKRLEEWLLNKKRIKN
jgi:hypothetical protein